MIEKLDLKKRLNFSYAAIWNKTEQGEAKTKQSDSNSNYIFILDLNTWLKLIGQRQLQDKTGKFGNFVRLILDILLWILPQMDYWLAGWCRRVSALLDIFHGLSCVGKYWINDGCCIQMLSLNSFHCLGECCDQFNFTTYNKWFNSLRPSEAHMCVS